MEPEIAKINNFLRFSENFYQKYRKFKVEFKNLFIFDFELTAEEMNEIRALDNGKRFFTMTLEEQERNLGAWKPED